MKTKFILFVLLFGFIFMGCNKEDVVISEQTEQYAEEVVFRTQESTNLGKYGCYDLVFPVTLNFPDGFMVDVTSYESMREEVIKWRKENPKVRTKPNIQFPFDVVNEDGELITVDNESEQRELKLQCGRNFFSVNSFIGHGKRRKLCFTLEYPFSVVLDNGVIVTIEKPIDRRLLHNRLKQIKSNYPNAKIKLNFVYPITVRLEDDTMVTINNQDELKKLIKDCK